MIATTNGRCFEKVFKKCYEIYILNHSSALVDVSKSMYVSRYVLKRKKEKRDQVLEKPFPNLHWP